MIDSVSAVMRFSRANAGSSIQPRHCGGYVSRVHLTQHATALLDDRLPPTGLRGVASVGDLGSLLASALYSNFTDFLCVSGFTVTIDGNDFCPRTLTRAPPERSAAANVSTRPSR